MPCASWPASESRRADSRVGVTERCFLLSPLLGELVARRLNLTWPQGAEIAEHVTPGEYVGDIVPIRSAAPMNVLGDKHLALVRHSSDSQKSVHSVSRCSAAFCSLRHAESHFEVDAALGRTGCAVRLGCARRRRLDCTLGSFKHVSVFQRRQAVQQCRLHCVAAGCTSGLPM